MLILFDHGTPKRLNRALSGHTVITAQSEGWDRLSNDALLDAAEQAAAHGDAKEHVEKVRGYLEVLDLDYHKTPLQHQIAKTMGCN